MLDYIKILLNPSKTIGFLLYQRYTLKKKYKTIKLTGKFFIRNSTFGNYNYVENAEIINSKIGDFSYIASNAHINLCQIGKFTCIGPNVKIGLGSHPTEEFISIHPVFYSISKQVGVTFSDKDYFEEFKKTHIGNDVWIGANVIVKSGVIIGDGAIIASGAVVTKDVKPFSMVGGIPAKLIKMRFQEGEINKILELHWWDKDIEWLKNNFLYFHSIKNIEKLKNI